MKVTIGGDRLGAGKKQKVELHGYERSTHNMSYLWRSTMAAGTLVPFLCEVGLPGDTFDIDLNTEVMTHPTVGPLFGSYKVQLDIFEAPLRLYQGKLHNNALGIGNNMSSVKLPQMTLIATPYDPNIEDTDNSQINPSCLLSYLGIRGVGMNTSVANQQRDFGAIPVLMYWDIYKNYYANKQEEIGAVIHTTRVATVTTITDINIDPYGTLPFQPAPPVSYIMTAGQLITITFAGATPITSQIIIRTDKGDFTLQELQTTLMTGLTTIQTYYNGTKGTIAAQDWRYKTNNELITNDIEILTFDLNNIDNMRESILADTQSPAPFIINNAGIGAPYDTLLNFTGGGTLSPYVSTQEGLALKTYQSDLLNNWLSTEWIDGPGGISEVTAIDTSGGSFTIDTFNLARKVYLMLNRIAISGGTYDDWQDAVYTHDRYIRCETPMYHGGLSKELVFQEVISNSASSGETGEQPLGTLAGRGTMSNKHKGGNIRVKVNEPSYIMGIISLTPRIDYSQGNKWDTYTLKTMDDLHKPALDEIGFQELITEQAAWWDTYWDATAGDWVQRSAGKQPAWINYMTNINQTRGNFAILSNEMFMTLNRRYTLSATPIDGIEDMTTYIDPSKFNFIFAQTSLDSQNFWTQIGVNMEVRRKMSAKVMPNL